MQKYTELKQNKQKINTNHRTVSGNLVGNLSAYGSMNLLIFWTVSPKIMLEPSWGSRDWENDFLLLFSGLLL